MAVIRTMVRAFHEDRRRLRMAPRTAGIVPVAWRIPKTPPMMNMKNMINKMIDKKDDPDNSDDIEDVSEENKDE